MFIRCPASREMRQMSRIFRKLHYFFSLPIILHFCLVTQQSDALPIKFGLYFARRQTPSIFHAWQPSSTTVYFSTPTAGSINTATVSDVPWWDGEAPAEKMVPRRKCKFNDDWRSHFAWIAKLPDNVIAQCNLCVTDFFDIVWWSHGCSPARRECTPR